ncbi:MAG: GTPase HflX [Candidatus Kaelpia aquatica]|nr:GTPase HflX [Candidatus Kaelpia aquatica]
MKENAYIIIVDIDKKGSWSLNEKADEMRELVLSTGCNIQGEDVVRVKKVNPHCFIGKGKIEEIACEVKELDSDVVIISEDLSATQQQNIEDGLGVKIIDRTQLILDIFSRHARSSEGKLQVELAQLNYLSPRLRGKGVMLSRLGGGIGTRGPGEKKLEVDRRRIRRRIEYLNKDLGEVKKRRASLRKKRERNEIPLIALIGYTNAGKTTLLNALTCSKQVSSNSMFTTLDPVSRVYVLPGKQKVLFADTVGFLNDLPHHLIDAFKATLEEIVEADLILHLLDISDPLSAKKRDSVYKVLDELDVKDKNILTVLNKIDSLSNLNREDLSLKYPDSILISALNKDGLDSLIERISEEFSSHEAYLSLFLPEDKMGVLSFINQDSIIDKKEMPGGVYIRARVSLLIRERIYQELSR